MLLQDFYIVSYQGKFYSGSKQKQHFIISSSILCKPFSTKVKAAFNFRYHLKSQEYKYLFGYLEKNCVTFKPLFRLC